MFNAYDAFQPLNGKLFSFAELEKALDDIRIAHRSELPPDCRTSELFELAQRNGWLREEGASLRIALSKPAKRAAG